MKERVQKIMAQANIGSRRACEKYIEEGRVTVNGKVITLGDKADPVRDTIRLDGKRIEIETQKTYIAVNKPINVVSSNVRQDDRPTVREILPFEGHFFTVGRLDAESTGLVLMTNDGELANRLSHPRYRHTKTYRVEVHGEPSQAVLDEWQTGIWLDDEPTAPCFIRVIKSNGQLTTLEIVMTEGKNRQIRRVASQLGFPVHKLRRVAIGQLTLDTLNVGEYKVLTAQEVKLLKLPSSDINNIPPMKPYLRAQKYKQRPVLDEDGQPRQLRTSRARREDDISKPAYRPLNKRSSAETDDDDGEKRKRPFSGRRDNVANDGQRRPYPPRVQRKGTEGDTSSDDEGGEKRKRPFSGRRDNVANDGQRRPYPPRVQRKGTDSESSSDEGGENKPKRPSRPSSGRRDNVANDGQRRPNPPRGKRKEGTKDDASKRPYPPRKRTKTNRKPKP